MFLYALLSIQYSFSGCLFVVFGGVVCWWVFSPPPKNSLPILSFYVKFACMFIFVLESNLTFNVIPGPKTLKSNSNPLVPTYQCPIGTPSTASGKITKAIQLSLALLKSAQETPTCDLLAKHQMISFKVFNYYFLKSLPEKHNSSRHCPQNQSQHRRLVINLI